MAKEREPENDPDPDAGGDGANETPEPRASRPRARPRKVARPTHVAPVDDETPGMRQRARRHQPNRGGMQASEILQRVGEQLNVRRVFGDPIERDGTTVIPVAFVAGGGGGGGGSNDKGESGDGAGMGGMVRPLGVYEIKNGETRFVPAIDATVVAVAALVTLVFTILPLFVRRLTR